MSIYDYLDYRQLLKDHYNLQKSKHPGYSFRVFAMRAKLTSPNYLKLVMDGKRRITDKLLPAFIRGLGLNQEEAKYFRLMVLFNEASDPAEKRDLLGKILIKRSRKTHQTHQVKGGQEQILKHWSHWVVREMVLLSDFKSDAGWVAEKLRKEITPRQAQESLDLLRELGFIEKNDERFVQADPKITTDDEVVSCLIRDLHAQMIELGVKSLFKDELSVREFAGLTIALNEDQIPKFKEKIKKFRQEMNAEFSSQTGDASRVYHLEMMFFPVSKGRAEC